MKRQAEFLLVLTIGWAMVSCSSNGSASSIAQETDLPFSATPAVTITLLPEVTRTPADLALLPTPPSTPVPEEVEVELVGIISSSSGRIFDYTGVDLESPFYGHIVATMYITQVIQGGAYLNTRDTIILNDCCLMPGAHATDLPQVGTAFRLHGVYRVDTGAMKWATELEYLGETTAYEPPPIVGKPGDIIRVAVSYTPRAVDISPGTQVIGIPNHTAVLQLLDLNWAQVVTGTVRLGEVVGVPELVAAEVLKAAP